MLQPIYSSIASLDGDDAETLTAALFLQRFSDFQCAEEPLQAIFDKVERAKQEWEATADSLPELICLIDHRGHIIRANRTAETWGLSQVVAVKDRDLHELIHPHCEDLFCYLHQLLHRYTVQAGECKPAEVETYDGFLKRHVRIRIQPVAEHKWLTSRTVAVIVQDISERKQAEDALRRYTQRLEMMNEIGEVILAACLPEDIAQAALGRIRQLVPFRQARVTLFRPESDDFFVLAANANGKTHLRPGRSYPREAFRGSEERRPDKFFRIEDLSSLSDLSPVEQQLLREGIRAYTSIPLVAEAEIFGSLSLGSDQPGAFDHEHIQIASEVADLLAIAVRQTRLWTKLKHANAELQAALQAKEQMIQNVSHELRSPLQFIYGYNDLLESGDLGPVTPEQRQAARIMRHKGETLQFMVERLLAMQTLDAKSLNRRPMDVSAWLKQTLQAWEIRAAQAGIQLELEAPDSLPSLLADPDFLGHVVTNLLDNAVKFSPDGGVVRVRVGAEADDVVLAVSDSGVGIPPAKLQQVFDRFYQVDSSMGRRFGGMGIGLALCQAIVQAHGGRIWAESAGEGQGSTFTVALPIEPSSCRKKVA